MLKYLIFGTLALAGLTAPAYAKDGDGPDAPDPGSPAATPFSGFRLEAVGGYVSTNVSGDGSDGIVYGGATGYDFRSGSMVFGVEVEGSDSTVDKCFGSILIAGDRICVQEGRDLFVGGRIGAVVGSRTLLYAKAGYTNGRVNIAYDDGIAGTAGDFDSGENLDGARAGVGAEFLIGSKTYAKIEYRYSNYEGGFDKHQGLVGFGIRF
jgi:outer membrane immunogenic protein